MSSSEHNRNFFTMHHKKIPFHYIARAEMAKDIKQSTTPALQRSHSKEAQDSTAVTVKLLSSFLRNLVGKGYWRQQKTKQASIIQTREYHRPTPSMLGGGNEKQSPFLHCYTQEPWYIFEFLKVEPFKYHC